MILKRITLLALGCVVGFAVCEVAARILWQAPWHERLIDEQRESETFEYERNRFNLRDDDYDYPKPTDKQRILMVGDSFTFGQGVKVDDEIFPERIERSLGQSPPATAPGGVEIMNGGLPGTLTDEWLRVWEAVVEEFDPDVLLIVFFLRDGTLTSSVPEFFDRIRTEISLTNRRSRLYRHSYVYRLIQDTEDRKRVASLYTDRFRSAYHGPSHQTGEWRRAQRNLLELRDRARARSTRVGFVIFPVLVELDDPYPFQEIVDTLETFARDSGFPTYNLLPDFMGRYAPSYWVSSFDQHPNAKGHALVAKSLEPFVRELLQGAHAAPKVETP